MDILIYNNPKNDRGVTPLHLAAAEGHLEICKQMLNVIEPENDECLDDLNPKDNEGSTPLHYSALNGHMSICRLLLRNLVLKDLLVDINPKNKFGFTPLHFAEKNGHLPIVEMFVHNIDDLRVTNRNMFTPMHFAANNGYLEVSKMLLKKMTIKNPKDVQGITPLHLAANTGRSAIFQLIYDQIPKTEKEQNPPDDYGNTPLHFAVRSGRVAICAIIFKNLEFVHPANKLGKTPLDLVDGHKSILHLYKRKNFNIFPQDLIIYRVIDAAKGSKTIDGQKYPKGITINIGNTGKFQLSEFPEPIIKLITKESSIFKKGMDIGGMLYLNIDNMDKANPCVKSYSYKKTESN